MPEMTSITHGEGCHHHLPHLTIHRHVYSGSPPLSPPPTSPLPPLPTSLPFQNLDSSASSDAIQRPRRTLRPQAFPRHELQAIVSSDRLQRKIFAHSNEDGEDLGAKNSSSPVQSMKHMRVKNPLQLSHPQPLVHKPLAAFTFTEEVLTALPNYFEPVAYCSRQIGSPSSITGLTEHNVWSPSTYYCLSSLMGLETRHPDGKSVKPTASPTLKTIRGPSGYNPRPSRQETAISARENAKNVVSYPASYCSSPFTQKQSPQNHHHLQLWNFPSRQPNRPKQTVTITDLSMHLGQCQGAQLQFRDFGVLIAKGIDSPQGSALSANNGTHSRVRDINRDHSSLGGYRTNAQDPSKNNHASSSKFTAKQHGLAAAAPSRKRLRSPGTQDQGVASSSATHEHAISSHPASQTDKEFPKTEQKSKREDHGSRLERNPEEADELSETAVVRSKKSKILWAIATILLVFVTAVGILAGIIWRLKTLDRDD